jgi:hypothetical protein
MLAQQHAEVMVRAGKTRIDRNGTPEFRFRFVSAAEPRQRNTPVAQGLDIIWFQFYGRTIMLKCGLKAALFGESVSEIVSDDRHILERNYSPVTSDGIVEPPRGVMRESLGRKRV